MDAFGFFFTLTISFLAGVYCGCIIIDNNHRIRTPEETKAAIVRYHESEAARLKGLAMEAGK